MNISVFVCQNCDDQHTSAVQCSLKDVNLVLLPDVFMDCMALLSAAGSDYKNLTCLIVCLHI